jgi:hypothetical protein
MNAHQTKIGYYQHPSAIVRADKNWTVNFMLRDGLIRFAAADEP